MASATASGSSTSKMSRRNDVILFCDWDETITSHDTLALIAPPDGEHPGVAFAEYGKAYMDDLAKHETQWKSKNAASGSSPRQRLENQLAFLASLDAVELASQQRIEAGGLFKGCDPHGIEERSAKHVVLREGWDEFTRTRLPQRTSDHDAQAHPLETHIISVGWSARFIQAGLRQTCVPTSICANEVEIDATTGRGTGRLTKSHDAAQVEALADQATNTGSSNTSLGAPLAGRAGIRIAQHKVREMRRILAARKTRQQATAAAQAAAPPPLLTVYAGDSTTDLGALLEADIGLILADKSSLRKVLIDELQLSDVSKSESSDAPIGRCFSDVDAALPHLDAHVAAVRAQAASDAETTSPQDGSGLPRAAASHRAFLIHVSNWHEAGRVLDAICSS